MHKYEKLTKREKIVIVGATVVTTCIAGYFGYKYLSGTKVEELMAKEIAKLKDSNLKLEDSKLKLEDSVDTLMAAASEGVFEEAIGTVNHKITYRLDKEKYLVEYLKTHPTHVDARNVLERVRAELSDLNRRKDKIEAAQKLYEIKNEN